MAAVTARRVRVSEVRDGVPTGTPLDLEPEAADAGGDGQQARGQVDRVGRRDGQWAPAGAEHVEVVVDGWRFEFRVEDAERAALRERASRAGDETGAGHGVLEIRAIIPGRIASVGVVAGDTVTAGQPLLVVEAMKMQNELKAPRDGVVERIGATAGSTIEIGDVLVVLA